MQQRMVLIVAADAGTVGDRRNADPPQLVSRTDAGTQQDRRRVDRAGAEHHLGGRQHLGLAVALGDDPAHAVALELQIQHPRLGQDLEVRPRAHLAGEVAARARGPLAVLAQRRGEEAVGRGLVDVGVGGHAAGEQRRLDAAHVERPFLARQAVDDVGRLGVAFRGGAVEVAGQSAEIGQHVPPAPVARAHRLPAVVVRRQAAQRDHPHDARAAAHHPRLRERPRRVTVGHAGGQVGPEIVAVGEGAREYVADVVGHRAGRGVLARLDQHHPQLLAPRTAARRARRPPSRRPRR